MDREQKISELIGYLSVEDDWDGYGGIPPTPTVILNIRNILNEIPIEVLLKTDEDNMCINPNGTVGMDFESGTSKTTIDVGEYSMTVMYRKNGEYVGFDKCRIGYCEEMKTSFKETGII